MQLDSRLKCPSCNKKLDGITATDGTDAIPEDGDYSICCYCLQYLQYKTTEFKAMRLSNIEEKSVRDELFKASVYLARHKEKEKRNAR